MKVFRTILLVINIVAAVGLVLTTLAGVVAPSKSILLSVATYGYLPMLVLNVAFIIVWLCMGRWQFAVSLAVIAVRWSFVGFFFQVGGTSKVPAAEEHPSMVKVMSFNVHQFGGNGNDAIPKDTNAAEFLLLVKEYSPDILCLQEFSRPKNVKVVDSLELMGYNHFFSAAGSNTIPAGTTVFSKLPITYVKKIDQQKVMVEVLGNEFSFRLCCVHMDSYAFDESDRNEISQLTLGKMDSASRRTLSKVKETILRHEEEWNEMLKPLVSECTKPLLLAGDMNDIPGSWLYQRIGDHLRDTYRDKGLGFCTTYNGGGDRLLSSGGEWLPHFRIDMVFRSEEFKTLSYKRIKTNISDHYPVMVALEIIDD